MYTKKGGDALTTQETVEQNAHQVKVLVPESRDQFVRMCLEELDGFYKSGMKLPSIVNKGWSPDPSGDKEIILEDVRIWPFQQDSENRLSPRKAHTALRMNGRKPLNGLEAVALVGAIRKGNIKLPSNCRGIHILGAGVGKRVLVVRQNKHGEWEFARIHSNQTNDYYFASCKA